MGRNRRLARFHYAASLTTMPMNDPEHRFGTDGTAGGPFFVAPSPAMLRSGAVWVTIQNWVQGARDHWGEARVLTPLGILSDHDLTSAAWGEPGSRRTHSRQRGAILSAAETAIKDVRSWRRGRHFERIIRSLEASLEPLFVWQHHDLFQTAGMSLARSKDRPSILFVDAPQVWEAEQWGVRRPGWGRFVERIGEVSQFREADLVACVSIEVGEAVLSRGVSEDRLLITPCTADSIRRASPTSDVRTKLGFDGLIVIGWVGSFRPFHNAEDLVRATAAVERAGHGVALLMLGEGPTLERCRELGSELGLRNVHLPGSVPHTSVAEYLHAMDVAVIPASSSGQFHYSPLKLKEFLAAGIPVVAPAVGEISRTLSDESDVLLYDPGDFAGMVGQLTRLVADGDLRNSLGAKGRETYDNLFTIDIQLNEVAERLGLRGSTDV